MLTLAEAAPVERAVVHEVSATVVNKGPISTSPGTAGRAGQGHGAGFCEQQSGNLVSLCHGDTAQPGVSAGCFGESFLNMQSLSMFCTDIRESWQKN